MEQILTPDWIFTFGKHKGRRLREVDERYIRWCREEIGWFASAYNRMIENQNGETRPADESTSKTTEEIDLGWFERMGCNFNDRGRV